MRIQELLRPAALLGLVASAWWIGVVVSGHYTSPLLNFWIPLGIQVVGLAAILRYSAPITPGYWRQVFNGVFVFAALALMLSIATYVGWEFLAPDYADRAVEVARDSRLAQGMSAAEAEEGLDALRSLYTPLRQSWFVIPATLATGFLASLILAWPLRGTAKDDGSGRA